MYFPEATAVHTLSVTMILLFVHLLFWLSEKCRGWGKEWNKTAENKDTNLNKTAKREKKAGRLEKVDKNLPSKIYNT